MSGVVMIKECTVGGGLWSYRLITGAVWPFFLSDNNLNTLWWKKKSAGGKIVYKVTSNMICHFSDNCFWLDTEHKKPHEYVYHRIIIII
jgi:hypothetical protein